MRFELLRTNVNQISIRKKQIYLEEYGNSCIKILDPIITEEEIRGEIVIIPKADWLRIIGKEECNLIFVMRKKSGLFLLESTYGLIAAEMAFSVLKSMISSKVEPIDVDQIVLNGFLDELKVTRLLIHKETTLIELKGGVKVNYAKSMIENEGGRLFSASFEFDNCEVVLIPGAVDITCTDEVLGSLITHLERFLRNNQSSSDEVLQIAS